MTDIVDEYIKGLMKQTWDLEGKEDCEA